MKVHPPRLFCDITMTKKRKQSENQDGNSALNNKRSRLNNPDSSDELPPSSQSRIDPTYGQRGAFPGLDNTKDDDGLFYGPASDGLEYIRMVRSEAKTVPNLLVAPISPTVQSKKNDLYADYPQGYYSNGAYTATPLSLSNPSQAYTNGGQQGGQDPQETYYASLCASFTVLTETLQSSPPRGAPDNTEVYYLDWRKARRWRGKILNTAPTMVLLARLSQESVICGLEVLESLLTLATLRGEKGKNIGAWTWGLLGRCREVGQMGSEEVGVLRKLGKQAVCLLKRISAGETIGGAVDSPDVDAQEEEDEEEGEGEEERVEDGADPLDPEDVDDGYSPYTDPITTAALRHDGNSEAHPIAMMSDADLAKAKQHIPNSLSTNDQAQTQFTQTNASNEDGMQSPTTTLPVTDLVVDSEGGLKEKGDEKATIHATLDILITIIGELYGQRDLLNGRLLWDEMQ
ncbi:MAG: hypothetical protein Q9175_007042 [Cornicularia normoerica]